MNGVSSRDVVRSAAQAFVLVALTCLPTVSADSIRVTRRGALSGSRFGLEIDIADRALTPGVDAFITLGPDKGLHGEISLHARLSLDVSGLQAASGSTGVLPFLRFGEEPGRNALVLFLAHDTQLGWEVGAWSWDETLRQFVVAGRAPLGAGVPRLEVQWDAASPGLADGRLRVLRVDAESADEPPLLLFESAGLANSGSIGFVQLGVLARDAVSGASGRLSIDDVELDRPAPLR